MNAPQQAQMRWIKAWFQPSLDVSSQQLSRDGCCGDKKVEATDEVEATDATGRRGQATKAARDTRQKLMLRGQATDAGICCGDKRPIGPMRCGHAAGTDAMRTRDGCGGNKRRRETATDAAETSD